MRVILTRSSVRRFRQEPLPEEALRKVLEAGIRAPTASAAEQWFFVLATSEEVRLRLFELLIDAHVLYASQVLRREVSKERIDRWRERLLEEKRYLAPAYIAAYVDLRERVCRDDYSELEFLWALQSVSAAIENMSLAAWGMGIGSVWLGVPLLMEERFNEVLGVREDGLRLAGILALGYPASEPRLRGRKKGLEEVVKRV